MSADQSCSKCNAPLTWIRTKAGKLAPCDPSPLPIVAPDGSQRRIVQGLDAQGAWHKGHEAQPGEQVLVEVYVSHFATCPEALHFRKPVARLTAPPRRHRKAVAPGR